MRSPYKTQPPSPLWTHGFTLGGWDWTGSGSRKKSVMPPNQPHYEPKLMSDSD